MPKKPLSKTDVPVWCLAWQTALGLTDWDIDVSLVPHAELMAKHNDSGVMGDCDIDPEHKYAAISALDPGTEVKHGCDKSRIDLEHILLHEHLHVCLHNLSGVFENILGLLGSEARVLMRHEYRVAQEQLINQLAKAFRRIKR